LATLITLIHCLDSYLFQDIRKHLRTGRKANAQGSIHALSFCRRYLSKCDLEKKPQFGRLADYMDLEKSGVVPAGKSSIFMKEYGELKEIVRAFIRTSLVSPIRNGAAVNIGLNIDKCRHFTINKPVI
jgi:hypothetical protein